MEYIQATHNGTVNIDINKALRDATKSVLIKCGKKLQEPDYIAGLTLHFIEKFHKILNKFYKRCSFSTAGIFCHQKPLAKFDYNSGSCEIGDILFIYIYQDIHKRKYYNSLLLQAKISDSEILKLQLPSEVLQLNLYSKWPKFYYSKAGKLNGKEHDITPKTFTNGAKYLLIDPTVDIIKPYNSSEYIYGTALAHNPLILGNQLSLELIDFINFKAGRTIEERPTGIEDDSWTKDEWSKLIWDMIDITKCSLARRTNIGQVGFGRRTIINELLFYDIGNNGNKNITDAYLDKELGGLSIVLIENQKLENNEYTEK